MFDFHCNSYRPLCCNFNKIIEVPQRVSLDAVNNTYSAPTPNVDLNLADELYHDFDG